MTFVKMKWDTVFNAAIDKQVEIEKWQEDWRERMIARFMEDTTGYLWWKRKLTREEAADRHIENCGWWVKPKTNALQRAKDLQRVAIEASKGYDDNTDFVYLDKEDIIFLFEIEDEDQKKKQE